jgi:hypothetical protein
MPRKDIYKDGVNTQFSSTNQPSNSGRKPNVFAKYLKEEVSLDDVRSLIASAGLYNADEIETILKNKNEKPPITYLAILKAMSADMKKGELKNHVILWDRAFGKSTQPVDIPSETLARISMTPEERRKRIEELLKKSESQPKKTGRKRTGRTSKPA